MGSWDFDWCSVRFYPWCFEFGLDGSDGVIFDRMDASTGRIHAAAGKYQIERRFQLGVRVGGDEDTLSNVLIYRYARI